MKPKTSNQLMTDNRIVKMYAGSIAYGTNLPTSDTDFRGIFIADPLNIRTPFFKIGESSDTSEEDSKYFELSKFCELASKCNPNVIELLYTDDEDIVFRTPEYDLLRENRDLFLTSRIAFTTSGYALSQLKRIKGHNKWINNPQSEEPPRQIDFLSLVQNFQSKKKFFKVDAQIKNHNQGHRLVPFGNNIYGVYQIAGYELYDGNYTLNTTFDDEANRHKLGVPLFIIKFNKEEYNRAKETYKQYWQWKNNRNEARGELEEQFGYDTKHAMHLVRLLRMGKEALTEGTLHIKRPDAQELLDIRNGKWTYEEVVDYAEEMDNDVCKVLYKKTELQKKPNLNKIGELIMELQDMMWSK